MTEGLQYIFHYMKMLFVYEKSKYIKLYIGTGTYIHCSYNEYGSVLHFTICECIPICSHVHVHVHNVVINT